MLVWNFCFFLVYYCYIVVSEDFQFDLVLKDMYLGGKQCKSWCDGCFKDIKKEVDGDIVIEVFGYGEECQNQFLYNDIEGCVFGERQMLYYLVCREFLVDVIYGVRWLCQLSEVYGLEG